MGLINSIENFYMADKQKCFDQGLVRFDDGEEVVYEPDKPVNIQNAKAYLKHTFSLSLSGKALFAFVTITSKNVWVYNLFQQIKIPLTNITSVAIVKKLFLQSVVIEERDGKKCTFTFGQTGALRELNQKIVDEISKLASQQV